MFPHLRCLSFVQWNRSHRGNIRCSSVYNTPIQGKPTIGIKILNFVGPVKIGNIIDKMNGVVSCITHGYTPILKYLQYWYKISIFVGSVNMCNMTNGISMPGSLKLPVVSPSMLLALCTVEHRENIRCSSGYNKPILEKPVIWIKIIIFCMTCKNW